MLWSRYLSENKLVSLEGLPITAPALTILDVASNRLPSLCGVSAYAALEDVWANTNAMVSEKDRVSSARALFS
jgi:hypothetical protein|eukprot:SAG25_NODE_165_length_13094_cov_31.386149_18_plen_73_part_00